MFIYNTGTIDYYCFHVR